MCYVGLDANGTRDAISTNSRLKNTVLFVDLHVTHQNAYGDNVAVSNNSHNELLPTMAANSSKQTFEICMIPSPIHLLLH